MKSFEKWDRKIHNAEYKNLKLYTDSYCKKNGMKQGSIIRSMIVSDMVEREKAFEAGQKEAGLAGIEAWTKELKHQTASAIFKELEAMSIQDGEFSIIGEETQDTPEYQALKSKYLGKQNKE